MIYFYAYVDSSKDSNINMKFIPKDCKGTFIDSANRSAGFETMLSMAASGDILRLPSLKMLGCDFDDIAEKIEILKEKRIVLETGDYGLLNTGAAKYIVDCIQEIQSEEKRAHVGRPKKVRPGSFEKVAAAYKNKELNAADAAKKLGVSRSTFIRWMKEDSEVNTD